MGPRVSGAEVVLLVGDTRTQGVLELVPKPWWMMMDSRSNNDPLVGGGHSWVLWWVSPILEQDGSETEGMKNMIGHLLEPLPHKSSKRILTIYDPVITL